MHTVMPETSGGVCSYTVEYWPEALLGLSSVLEPMNITGGNDASVVGEEVFEAMVNASTEEKLAEHLADMKSAVAVYEVRNKS